MSYLHIKTLTPVHIGSGNMLQENFDFITLGQNHARDKTVAILDLKKILETIGEDRLPQWRSVIDRGESLYSFLRQVRGNVGPEMIAQRHFPRQGGGPRLREMREQIQDGRGNPMMPGTSLKGAFRTAFLAGEIAKQPAFVQQKRNLMIESRGRVRYDDKFINKNYLAKDINKDRFRFFRIGDAAFNQTTCIKVDTLNLARRGWEFKERITHYAEALPPGVESLAHVHFASDLAQLNKDKNYLPQGATLPTPHALLKTVHQHNLNLLEREIKFWDTENVPAPAGDYYAALQDLLESARNFKEGESLMRLGYGIGWRAITGGWAEAQLPPHLLDPLLHNLAKYPNQPFYPKSRRMAEERWPIGYVKVQLLNDTEAADWKSQYKEPVAEEVALQPQKEVIPVSQREPTAPVTYFKGKLKPGVEVNGEYLRPDPGNPKMKVFKLFLGEEGKEQEVACRYPADMEIGKKVKIRIQQVTKKGQVQNIAFIGYL